MVKEKIEKLIKESLKEFQKRWGLSEFKIPEILIEEPREKERGDYATNIAMKIAETFQKKPMETADLLAGRLKRNKELFAKVETAKPGFINFFLSQEVLFSELKKILKEKEKYGQSNLGQGKIVIVDYSGLNVAKPFGVGHLRSTIIGQAIYNLYKFLGYKTIGDNHLGDWGTQFGKLIYAIKNWGNEKEINKDPIKSLVGLYVKFHREAEKDPKIEEQGRKWFKKLEQGNKEAKRLWKKCLKWSLGEFEKVYKILGVKMDLTLGESFYQPMLKSVIKEALDKGVAKKSQGAIIIPFPDKSLPPLLIQKSDGATLYSTRDLAAISYRRKKFKPYKIIYEVGVEQTLYFKQLFWAAELLGWGRRDDYVHIAHGMMRLATGRMSTRKGEIIFLKELLKEAFERAAKIIKEKNPKMTPGQRAKTAKIIGLAAIKYNNLARRPLTEIVFDWDRALNLEGDSGPYLQYAYVRAKNIIKKSKTKIIQAKKGKFKQEKEIQLLKQLVRFPEIIEAAEANYAPNLVCGYLVGLARDFNRFYEAIPVLKEREINLRTTRLALVKAFAQVMKNGLSILGIKVLEKM
jgi:arginyl-tRNA synthetase